jgi:hypothetical protein
VTEAYWAVVYARTDVWARRQQVEQGEAAFARSEARQRQGFGNAAEVAQTRVSLANFRANLITAEANLLQREAVLRNLLGLPPTDPPRITPTSPPTPQRYDPNWDELVHLAERQRPDLIELKLIIEADEQNLLIAKNQALPQVNATMLYRWNGLEGTTPGGQRLETGPGAFTDWSMGVNFSVPLGLRAGRAGMRQAELILCRDKANLEQGVHFAVNEVATSVRNISQFYEEYKAFRETRAAARINLEQQLAEFRAGRAIFLNVLQAITDWGQFRSPGTGPIQHGDSPAGTNDGYDPGDARRALLRGAVPLDRPVRPARAGQVLPARHASNPERGSLSGRPRSRGRGAGERQARFATGPAGRDPATAAAEAGRLSPSEIGLIHTAAIRSDRAGSPFGRGSSRK